MGWAIATAGLGLFSSVDYIAGPGHERFRRVEGASNVSVDTTEEMLEAVMQALAPRAVLIMAAAPADYAPVEMASGKIKKDPSRNLKVEFRPTPDILMEVGRSVPDGMIRVAFAAETDHIRENALTKMKKKNVDFICANQVFKDGMGFAADAGALLVIDRAGNEKQLGPMPKDALGPELLSFLASRLEDG